MVGAWQWLHDLQRQPSAAAVVAGPGGPQSQSRLRLRSGSDSWPLLGGCCSVCCSSCTAGSCQLAGEVWLVKCCPCWFWPSTRPPAAARPSPAGRLTGQATGYLYRARAKFFKFAEDAEVTKASPGCLWWLLTASAGRQWLGLIEVQHRARSSPGTNVSIWSNAPLLVPAAARGGAGNHVPAWAVSQQFKSVHPLLFNAAARGDAGHDVPTERDPGRAAGRHEPVQPGVSDPCSNPIA